MKNILLVVLAFVLITFCNDRKEKERDIIEITEDEILLNKWKIPRTATLSDFTTKFTFIKNNEINDPNLRIYLENGLEISESETKDRVEGFKINYDSENKENIPLYLGSLKIQNIEISKFTNPETVINYLECRGIFCRKEIGNTRIFFIMNIDRTKINSVQIYF